MPTLPGGFVDVNKTWSLTNSGTMKILVWETVPSMPNLGVEVGVGGSAQVTGVHVGASLSATCEWDLPPETNTFVSTIRVYVTVGGTSYVLTTIVRDTGLDEYHIADIVLVTPFWTSGYAATLTYGPYHLGARFYREGEGEYYPMFDKQFGVLLYEWFGFATEFNETITCSGHSATWNAPYDFIQGQSAGLMSWTNYGGYNPLTGEYSGHVTSPTLNGHVADTQDAPKNGLINAAPNVTLTYDLTVRDYGGASRSIAAVDSLVCLQDPNPYGGGSVYKTPYRAELSTPLTETFEFRGYGWSSRYKAAAMAFDGVDVHVSSGACLAQDPPLPTEDRQFSIRGVPLRLDPTTDLAKASGYYYPVTLSIASSLDVHRPDGVKRSNFVTSDGAKLAVSEGASTTTFTVTTAGASATRTPVTHWNRYFDPTDPLFSWSAYAILKHRSDLGEDIWWWGTYAYLRTRWRCPVATTLTLRLDWVHLQVTDSHETSQVAREDAFEVTSIAGFANYTIALAADAVNDQTVNIDLLVPAGAITPWYPGRITSIQLSGFVPGGGGPANVELKDMSLVSVGSKYYPKAAVSTTEQRKQYSMITLAHDGAWVTGYIPDPPYKPNQGNSDYGGGPRHTDPMIGSVSGIIQDAMKSVQAVWAELNLIEGITATYDSAAFEAANGDGVTLLSIEPADFIWNYFPPAGGLDLGTAWQPKCCLTAFRLKPCNGLNFRVMGELDTGAGIETLVINPDGSRGASVSLQGYWLDGATKHVVATATTDSQGYAVVSPLPANRGADEENIDSGVELAT